MSKKKKNDHPDYLLFESRPIDSYQKFDEPAGPPMYCPYVDKHATLVADTVKPVTYHLYVSLLQCPVKVYRRITVPSNLRLEHLAKIIIRAMGWDDVHEHRFFANGRIYAPKKGEEGSLPSWSQRNDSMAVTIGDVLKAKAVPVKFVYDLGDNWIHQVRLSSVEEECVPGQVTLDSGGGGCPPEDVGGVYGYAQMLEEGEVTASRFSLSNARLAVAAYVKHVLEQEQPYKEKDKQLTKGANRSRTVRLLPYTFAVSYIRNLHPHSLPPSPTDQDYALLANRLERALLIDELNEIATADAMKAIISRVIMYYEDIIADAGMWRGFVAKNKELYGRPYPFYPVEGEVYTDEPDLNAVRLLVWDAFHEFRGPDRMINPENPVLNEVAQILYDILDNEFENTPINEQLADYFRKASFANDFFELRDVLKWILFDCYLTSDGRAHDLVKDAMDEFDPLLTGNEAYYSAECVAPFVYQVGMLALLPKDWLALFIAEVGDKQVAKKIASIEKSEFIEVLQKKAYDKNTVSFEDIDGNQIVINRDSHYVVTDKDLKEGEGAVGSYAKYDGQWYLNGNQLWGETDRIFDSFKSIKKYQAGFSEEQYKHLMELSGGSPLFYFKTPTELDRFLSDYDWKKLKKSEFRDYDRKRGIALFVPGVNKPLAIMPGAAECIKDPRNPYYNKERAKTSALNIIGDGKSILGVVARYLISHGMIPDAGLRSLKGEDYGRKLLQDNLDFFARAYRREDY